MPAAGKRASLMLAALAAALLAACLAPARALAATGDLGEPALSEARSAIICDQDGRVLYSKNADDELPMASITKIMTAMVALDSGKPLDDPCTIEVPQFEEGAQMAGYTASDTPTLRELLRTMLVYSANDSAYNVALNVAGSIDAFADLMNQKAQELGMSHTHFMNPHGLEEDGHYSSASDLVVMGRYALENYPFIRQTVLSRSVTATVGGNPVTLRSTDDLMDTYAGLCGIKTGAVESGTAFLGACKRHGITLYSCVLGCTTHAGRFTDTEAMMNWAFDTYARYPMVEPSRVIRIVPWADGFWGKLAVSTESAASAYAWPEDVLVYHSQMTRPQLMVEPGAAYGSLSYTDDDRLAGQTTYRTSGRVVQVPAVNVFALPYFFDMSKLEAA